MSGGSYDYLFSKVDLAAEDILARRSTPLRRAFCEHLKLVSKALRDIEWVDSCDSSEGSEDAAIRKVLGPGADKLATQELIKELDQRMTQLREWKDQLSKEGE